MNVVNGILCFFFLVSESNIQSIPNFISVFFILCKKLDIHGKVMSVKPVFVSPSPTSIVVDHALRKASKLHSSPILGVILTIQPTTSPKYMKFPSLPGIRRR